MAGRAVRHLLKAEEPRMTQEVVNVICIHWGNLYGVEYINRLYSMIRRNTTLPLRFHVFSDELLDGIDKKIIHLPEPRVDLPEKYKKFNYNYRKSPGLYGKNLGDLKGQRVFFFDLDMLITSSLDELFQYPKDDKFYIIRDWKSKRNSVGQSSCHSFVVGSLSYMRDDFEKDPEPVIENFGTATQQYLSAKVIEREGKLNFWPEEWFRSFKYHCLPHPLLRRLKTPEKPKPQTKVLVFHGNPNLEDAIAGRWSSESHVKAAKGLKKLYKACRPTPWIKDLWY